MLTEKYRPQSLADVAGQKRAIQTLNILEERGIRGRAFWISGPSGTGKTTIARIIASKAATDICTFEADGKELSVGMIEDWERKSRLYGWGDPNGWAFIVNEAHGLNKNLITRLLTVLERIRHHVVWIFTTTNVGQLQLFEDQIDAGPLTSRCVQLHTEVSDLDFALRAQRIARQEGLDGQEISAYLSLGGRCKWNLRAMLQEIESGAMLST